MASKGHKVAKEPVTAPVDINTAFREEIARSKKAQAREARAQQAREATVGAGGNAK